MNYLNDFDGTWLSFPNGLNVFEAKRGIDIIWPCRGQGYYKDTFDIRRSHPFQAASAAALRLCSSDQRTLNSHIVYTPEGETFPSISSSVPWGGDSSLTPSVLASLHTVLRHPANNPAGSIRLQTNTRRSMRPVQTSEHPHSPPPIYLTGGNGYLPPCCPPSPLSWCLPLCTPSSSPPSPLPLPRHLTGGNGRLLSPGSLPSASPNTSAAAFPRGTAAAASPSVAPPGTECTQQA